MFIVLLSFSESLATKRLFLNDKPYTVWPTLIDLNQAGLQRKYPTCGCHIPKQCFMAMACDSKSHVILWSVISVNLNIGWKLTRLGMMTLNREKSSMFSNLWSWCLRWSYTLYGDILENRQVGRRFKLV